MGEESQRKILRHLISSLESSKVAKGHYVGRGLVGSHSIMERYGNKREERAGFRAKSEQSAPSVSTSDPLPGETASDLIYFF